MEPPSREITVEVPDGTRVVVTLTPAGGAPPGAPVVLCVPAMGVRASYYRPLTDALRDQGLNAAAFDLRGNGTSSVRAGRRSDFGYREIVELDFPAVLAAVREALPESDVLLLGHSLGASSPASSPPRGPRS